MLVDPKPQTMKMISTRADDEMFFALRGLSQMTGTNVSTIIRLAIEALLVRAREKRPTSWEDLKMIAHEKEGIL
jgi:predicted DNA-binding protein